MDINNNTNAEAINTAFTSLSLSLESDTEHTRIGVLYDISVHKSDLACIDAPASSGRARWANDVIVHLGDNISISTASSNKKHLLLIITPSELLSFTQHMFPNIDVVPILNLHKFGKSMGIPGMGLKKDEFKEAEFRFRLMFKVNDAMGHGLEGLHWNQAFYDIQKVKGIFAVNIAYYWMDTSSNNLNHPVVISIGMKMHKLFETVWPDAIFDGDPLSNTHQIEVPNQSNGEDCGFQSIELFRVLLPCKLQPFGDTAEFVKSTSRVTSDTINTARLNLKDNIIQKLLQAKHQVSDAMELIDDMDGALASLLEPALSSINEDGIVGSADDVAQQAIQVDNGSNNTVALSTTTNDMGIDVNGLHDDVDTVLTEYELSRMRKRELKELCKNNGLSQKGNMTKLIERFLGAQANGFPAKKKPMTPAERKAKSRANQSDEKKKQVRETDAKQHAKSRANRSDEKKKEDNKKTLAYNTKVRRAEAALIEWKRPTEDTKVWEVPGKDYLLDKHESDPWTTFFLFHIRRSYWKEWPSYVDTAFYKVHRHINELIKKVKDPSILDGKDKLDFIQRLKGRHALQTLFMIGRKEKIHSLQLIGEIIHEYNIKGFKTWRESYCREGLTRDESPLMWLALTEKGLEIVRQVAFTKQSEHEMFSMFSAFKDDSSVSIIEPPFQEAWDVLHKQDIRSFEVAAKLGLVQGTDPLETCHEDLKQNEISLLHRQFKRHLVIHGFDVDWMKSIIGLRLSIPEWWWRDENGNPYSKSNKLWKGEIIDVRIPDYKYNRTYVDGDSQYFMFKCDDGDDNKYPMRYSEVWKFADDDQFDKFVLPIKMPEKSVDKDYHSHCVHAFEQVECMECSGDYFRPRGPSRIYTKYIYGLNRIDVEWHQISEYQDHPYQQVCYSDFFYKI